MHHLCMLRQIVHRMEIVFLFPETLPGRFIFLEAALGIRFLDCICFVFSVCSGHLFTSFIQLFHRDDDFSLKLIDG